MNTQLWAVLLAGFACFLNLYAPQPLLPALTTIFHVSHAAASLTVTASTLAIALAAPFAGTLVQSLGRRRVLTPAVYGIAVTSLFAAMSPDLKSLIVWRFVQGLFLPVVFASMFSFIGEEWEGKVGRVMALYVASNVVGGFVGRVLSGVVDEQLGWRAAFFILFLLDLACGLALLRWIPDSPPAPRRWSLTDALKPLQSGSLRVACGVGFNVLFSLLAVFTYVTFHLADAPFRLGPGTLGLVFVVYLVGVVVTPMAGQWIDRLGYRSVLIFATVAASVGALLTLASWLPAVIAGLAICASGVFVSQSAASGYVTEMAGGSRAAASGLYLSCYYAGGSAGASLPGLFWNVGGWTACILLVVAVQMGTIALALRLQESHGLRTIHEDAPNDRVDPHPDAWEGGHGSTKAAVASGRPHCIKAASGSAL